MSKANRSRVLRLLAAGALMLVAGSALAYSGGPPDGRTGAPGEGTCVMCHSTFPLNSGSGMISLAGLPTAYAPGESYDLTLTVEDPDASRWGFELTVLDDAGDALGTLVATDGGTQLSSSSGRDYLKQNSSGTYPGTSGSASWSFRWTAPPTGAGNMNLYAAGNGANNNGGSSGDRIYATSFTAEEDTGVPVFDTPGALALHGAVPNPFNPSTQIRFDLPQAGNVRVTVLTVDGRRVATLVDGPRSGGPQAVAWDGRDHGGRPMGSGTYMFVVEAAGQRAYGRMTLLK
jgi:hypothetical protein